MDTNNSSFCKCGKCCWCICWAVGVCEYHSLAFNGLKRALKSSTYENTFKTQPGQSLRFKRNNISVRGYKCNNPMWCISCILLWLSATSYCWERRVRQENSLIWCSFTKYEQSLQLTGSESNYSAEKSICKNSKMVFVVSSYLKSCFMNNFGELEENSGNLQSKYGNKALKHLTLQNWNSDYFFLVGQEV